MKNDFNTLEPENLTDSKCHHFKDIYLWEHSKELQSIKAPYPDSLSTRLKSTNETPSVKQVINPFDYKIHRGVGKQL